MSLKSLKPWPSPGGLPDRLASEAAASAASAAAAAAADVWGWDLDELGRVFGGQGSREGNHTSGSSSSSSSSSAESRWWGRYLERPSRLFSSLTFYVDGLQRLEGPEVPSAHAAPQAHANACGALSSSSGFDHVIDDVQLKRVLLAHGGIVSIVFGKDVTHVLADNIALGNSRWRKFRPLAAFAGPQLHLERDTVAALGLAAAAAAVAAAAADWLLLLLGRCCWLPSCSCNQRGDRGGFARRYVVVRCAWVFGCIDAGRLLPTKLFKPRGLQLTDQQLLPRWGGGSAASSAGGLPRGAPRQGEGSRALTPLRPAAQRQQVLGAPRQETGAAGAEVYQRDTDGRLLGRNEAEQQQQLQHQQQEQQKQQQELQQEQQQQQGEQLQQEPPRKKARFGGPAELIDLDATQGGPVSLAGGPAVEVTAAPPAGAAAARSSTSPLSAAEVEPAAGAPAAAAAGAAPAAAAAARGAYSQGGVAVPAVRSPAPAAPAAAAAAARTPHATAALRATSTRAATPVGAAPAPPAAAAAARTEGRGGILDCRHPDFVSSFFEHSRLHFIGAWQGRCTSMLSRLLNERSSTLQQQQQQQQQEKQHQHQQQGKFKVFDLVDASVSSKELLPLVLPLGLTLPTESDVAAAAAAAAEGCSLLQRPSPTSAAAAAAAAPVAAAAAAAATATGEGRWILHIDFDAFFVSVALLKYPHLRDKPASKPTCCCRCCFDLLLLLQGCRLSFERQRGGCLALDTYAARAQGVEKGMWVHTAVSRCPSLVLLPYDFEGIEKACEGLFRAVLSLSHRLAPLSCDEWAVQLRFFIVSLERFSLKKSRDSPTTVQHLIPLHLPSGVSTSSPCTCKQQQQQQQEHQHQQQERICMGVSQTFVEICFPLVSQAQGGPEIRSKSSGSNDSNSSSSSSSSINSGNSLSSSSSGGSSKSEAEIVADVCSSLREAVLSLTGCTVSIGAGSNCLLAKVATSAAKPGVSPNVAAARFPAAAAAAVIRREGVCVVRPGATHAAEFMGPLLLRRLPGVGHSAAARIAAAIKVGGPAGAAAAAKTCTDVQKTRKEALQLLQAALAQKLLKCAVAHHPWTPLAGVRSTAGLFCMFLLLLFLVAACTGRKRGAQLWWLCHGVDVRPLPPPLPTVAAAAAAAAGSAAAAAAAAAASGSVPASGTLSISVNWGIRIESEADLLNLLRQIAQEGSKRLTNNKLYTARITLKVLYRAPGTSANTTKFLGCGLCDSVRGTRTVGGNSSRSSGRAGGVSFGVQSTEDLYEELKTLWRETLSDACPLEDYRGINLALQQLRTEQQEEALRRQQMHMQLRFSGGGTRPASILSSSSSHRSSSSSHSSSSHSSSRAAEPSLIVIDPTQPAAETQQQQQPPHQVNQQQAQQQQKVTNGQQQSEHHEIQEEAKNSLSFECCLVAASTSSKSGDGNSSSGADSSSSERKETKVFSPKTPCRPLSASQTKNRYQPSPRRLSAAVVARAGTVQQSPRGRLQVPQGDLKTPERRTPLQSQEQQQQHQQQWGVRTPESEAATPLLMTPKLDDSNRWAREDRVSSKISSSNWKASPARSAKRSASAASAAAAAAAAAAGASPAPTQMLLEDFLPSSNTGSPYTPIMRDPKRLLSREKRRRGSSCKGRGDAATAASSNVISLLTQHPPHRDCSGSSRSSSASSCAGRRSPRKQQQDHRQQRQEDCCCGALDVSKCCCASEACTSQCMRLICPSPVAFPRESPSLRAVSAAWRVLLLLLQHAAATGAAAAKRSGSAALVAAAVTARIANAASPSSGADCTAEQQPPAAAGAVVKPHGSSGGSLEDTACCSSDSAGAPAAAAESTAAAGSEGAASSPRASLPGPPRSGGPPAMTSAGEGEAEGFYWECVAELLEGFGSALRKVAAELAAVGAYEERQVLLRFLLRTLQSPEARIAAASAAASAVAAASAAAAADAAAATDAVAAGAAVSGATDGGLSRCSSSVSLSQLLLRLLVCPAGRLVWPLLLQRVQDATCFDGRSFIMKT
ncbi:hypothetical protein ACSSS7_008059 [Eimeria intestinalis]